jgi:hypothetical protein
MKPNFDYPGRFATGNHDALLREAFANDLPFYEAIQYQIEKGRFIKGKGGIKKANRKKDEFKPTIQIPCPPEAAKNANCTKSLGDWYNVAGWQVMLQNTIFPVSMLEKTLSYNDFSDYGGGMKTAIDFIRQNVASNLKVAFLRNDGWLMIYNNLPNAKKLELSEMTKDLSNVKFREDFNGFTVLFMQDFEEYKQGFEKENPQRQETQNTSSGGFMPPKDENKNGGLQMPGMDILGKNAPLIIGAVLALLVLLMTLKK